MWVSCLLGTIGSFVYGSFLEWFIHKHTMHTPHQIWRHATPKAQLLIALALATVLAFSAGLASGIYGRTLYAFLTVNRTVSACFETLTFLTLLEELIPFFQ